MYQMWIENCRGLSRGDEMVLSISKTSFYLDVTVCLLDTWMKVYVFCDLCNGRLFEAIFILDLPF